jgi:hypothetical protein
MPHFVRIFFIAFASAAASCSSERAQKEAERNKEMGRELTRHTTLVYERHSRRSYQQWSIAIWQWIRLLWSAEPKNRSFEHSKILFQRIRMSAMRPCRPTAIR